MTNLFEKEQRRIAEHQKTLETLLFPDLSSFTTNINYLNRLEEIQERLKNREEVSDELDEMQLFLLLSLPIINLVIYLHNIRLIPNMIIGDSNLPRANTDVMFEALTGIDEYERNIILNSISSKFSYYDELEKAIIGPDRKALEGLRQYDTPEFTRLQQILYCIKLPYDTGKVVNIDKAIEELESSMPIKSGNIALDYYDKHCKLATQILASFVLLQKEIENSTIDKEKMGKEEIVRIMNKKIKETISSSLKAFFLLSFNTKEKIDSDNPEEIRFAEKLVTEDENKMIFEFLSQPCFEKYSIPAFKEFEADMRKMHGESVPYTKHNQESKYYSENLDWSNISSIVDFPDCDNIPHCMYKTFSKPFEKYKCPKEQDLKKKYLDSVRDLVNDIAKTGIIEDTDDTKFAFFRTLTGIYIETDVEKAKIIPKNPITKGGKAMKIDINLNAVLYICKEMFNEELSKVFNLFDCVSPYGETGYTKHAKKLDDRLGDAKKKIEDGIENIKKKAASR